MAWLHPIGGALGASLVLWIGMQGLRARHRAAYAARARATHGRFAPYIYGLVVAVACAGTASVVLLRPDLEPASSIHFWTLWSVVVVLTGSFLTARAFGVRPDARQVHAWLGVVAMIAIAIGAVLGLGMLPD